MAITCRLSQNQPELFSTPLPSQVIVACGAKARDPVGSNNNRVPGLPFCSPLPPSPHSRQQVLCFPRAAHASRLRLLNGTRALLLLPLSLLFPLFYTHTRMQVAFNSLRRSAGRPTGTGKIEKKEREGRRKKQWQTATLLSYAHVATVLRSIHTHIHTYVSDILSPQKHSN